MAPLALFNETFHASACIAVWRYTSGKANYFCLGAGHRKLWENDLRLPWPLPDHADINTHNTDLPQAATLHKDGQFLVRSDCNCSCWRIKERQTLGLFTYWPEEKGGGKGDKWVLCQQQQTISQFDQWTTTSEERDRGQRHEQETEGEITSRGRGRWGRPVVGQRRSSPSFIITGVE